MRITISLTLLACLAACSQPSTQTVDWNHMRYASSEVHDHSCSSNIGSCSEGHSGIHSHSRGR